ncbi:hypothetical protein P691DRAFT_713666 [Macrolepiota fuliginosa MF-IS2]|uniref:F-box domain-containing protein n=1 Tax=Macrolepiota fuliginosa MF-IS2 TaxID=1400762 RepID=A0A9P6BZ32_9AGAR|nr:hypothetical protein P691DRAFT_713666 [Macrolepiota fuliginosa MF-IS2]
MMFETMVVYGSSGGLSNDPIQWLAARDGLKTSGEDCTRLVHMLDTLYTKQLPIASRRARHLNIFVSDLFRLHNSTVQSTGQELARRDLQDAVQRLLLTLPSIIRNLGNLGETTLYISSYEPEDFIQNISKALLALPQLETVNVNILDQKAVRILQIAESQRLKSMKISWPMGEPYPMSPPRTAQPSIYTELPGIGIRATNLKRLEICAKHRLSIGSGLHRFNPLPQLEELVLENVPVSLDGEAVKAMTQLQSLRLGGFDCLNCDPHAAVWASLKLAGRKLRVVGVDVVGQALVDYLDSYEGLETLVLKLRTNANDYCVNDFCARGLRHHKKSLKFLHIDLDPHSDFRITWFFEYWSKWIPTFSNLSVLKATTSMNLHSEFDSRLFIDEMAEIVTRMPTLSKITIRHIHEGDSKITETVLTPLLTEGGSSTVPSRPLAVAPSCLLVMQDFESLFRITLDRGQGLYGTLKFVSCGK